MPAPTALLRRPKHLVEQERGDIFVDSAQVTSDVILDTQSTPKLPSDPSTLEHDTVNYHNGEQHPSFPPARNVPKPLQSDTRKVPVPPHRMSPLKTAWPKLYPPLVSHLNLQVRMNVKAKAVEIRTSSHSTDPGALQKAADFLKAFTLGFEVDDAIALLRLDDLYIETFEIKDVKMLNGEHLGRAVGRIAGKDGKTKFAIENASRTRVVLADTKVHVLGAFRNIHIAREAIVSLILGSPPSKVYGNLRTVASRMKERF